MALAGKPQPLPDEEPAAPVKEGDTTAAKAPPAEAGGEAIKH